MNRSAMKGTFPGTVGQDLWPLEYVSEMALFWVLSSRVMSSQPGKPILSLITILDAEFPCFPLRPHSFAGLFFVWVTG